MSKKKVTMNQEETIFLKFCRPYWPWILFPTNQTFWQKKTRDKNNSLHQCTCNHAKTGHLLHWLHRFPTLNLNRWIGFTINLWLTFYWSKLNSNFRWSKLKESDMIFIWRKKYVLMCLSFHSHKWQYVNCCINIFSPLLRFQV